VPSFRIGRKNPARIKAGRGKFVLSAGVNIPRQANPITQIGHGRPVPFACTSRSMPLQFSSMAMDAATRPPLEHSSQHDCPNSLSGADLMREANRRRIT
jgi:hypothetical protein